MRLCCQELFSCGFPVLAHGIGADPVLIYANAAALQLWGRRWADMVACPHDLPPQMRSDRNVDKR